MSAAKAKILSGVNCMKQLLVGITGSKIRFRTSGRIPGPLSETLNSAVSSSRRRVRTLIWRLSVPASPKRINGIHYQVKNDLFQLDTVTFDNQRIGNEGSLQFDVMGCGLRSQNADHFRHNLIQGDIFSFNYGLGESRRSRVMTSSAR